MVDHTSLENVLYAKITCIIMLCIPPVALEKSTKMPTRRSIGRALLLPAKRKSDTPAAPQEPDPQELEDDPNFIPEDDPDLKASMIFFKDLGKGDGMRAYSHPRFAGEFPNQKIQLKTLIFETNPLLNPLAEKCEPAMIRYFHLPANNMTWVEVGDEFIAQRAVG
jgi:hypothetical protein